MENQKNRGNKDKCKYCTRRNDFHGSCDLNGTRRSPDDTCAHPSSAFDVLLDCGIGEILARLNQMKLTVSRCCNTKQHEILQNRIDELRREFLKLGTDIRNNPGKYWEVPDNLGTCGNCARLDRTNRLVTNSGHMIEGTCPFAPPGCEGRIQEHSWRGCAQWIHD